VASPSFQIGILPNRPIDEVAALAVEAERVGFDGVWIADSQSIFRDVFASLTLCAARTSRITLATGVTNPVTRHPAVIASAFATLDELAGGRTILGIGVGESAVETLQLEPARLRRLEEVTKVVRSLLAGEEATLDGASMRITWAERSIPIVYASSGPKSLQLAGRAADGVLFQVGSDPALVRYALDRIDSGIQEAGRDRSAVTRYVRLACTLGADRAQARDEARAYVAVAAGTVFANVPRDVLPPDVWTDMQEMKDRYDYYQHASPDAGHKDLVTDRIIDAIAIAGTPDEAVPRFRELIDVGVDGFVIPVTAGDPFETIRRLAKEVIGRL
jgi:5,10-methylenetetrahydromethanopterin reductase